MWFNVELMNSQSPIDIVGKFRVGDIRHACADFHKIKKALGFVPKMDLQEGLKNFIAWVNQQPARIDLYENMEKEMIEKGLMGKDKSA